MATVTITTMTTISTDLSLLRLLRLASPALPVGAFSYSQALEWAVESGTVTNIDGARRWIIDALKFTVARTEAPIWCRLHRAWLGEDDAAIAHWGDLFLATREGAELRAETVQMGRALRTLILRSGEFPAALCAKLEAIDEPSYPLVFSAAVAAWKIDARAALTAYLWSWAENQVIAAIKLVPLGQTDGQQLLANVIDAMPPILDTIFAVEDDDIGALSHSLAIASAKHETQYSRLFRS